MFVKERDKISVIWKRSNPKCLLGLLKFDVNQLKGSQCGNHFNAKQDGLQGSSEHFAIPGLKQTSSIIR